MTYSTSASLLFLFAEMQGFMCAIQDNVVATRAYKKFIMWEQMENDQCRMRHSALERLDYLYCGVGAKHAQA